MGTTAAAARLVAALESPGHAAVIAEDGAAADAFFRRVDPQLACHRRLRIPGPTLNPDGVVRALAIDLARGRPWLTSAAIVTALVAGARAARLPIVIAVTSAEEASPARLERLHTLFEQESDGRAFVRLVLLGGPGWPTCWRGPRRLRIGGFADEREIEARTSALRRAGYSPIRIRG